jgi:RecA/RadA recombinase
MAKTEDTKALEVLSVLDEYSAYSTFLDKSTLSNVDGWIDTGSKMLNAIISGSLYGGIPIGRVTLLAGESATGKSYIAQKIVGNAQRLGMYTVVFDSENAIDASMAKSLGADPSKIKYFPVKSIEQVRNAIFALLEKIEEAKMEGKFLIVIDSLANMVSEMEAKRMGKDSTSADMGTIAKAIKSLLKTCTTYGGLTKTTFLVTNHIYDNPNEMYPDLVKCMNGGKACRYLPSVVIQLAKKNLKDSAYSGQTEDVALSKGISGIEMRCMCVKNRFVRPLVEGSMYLSWKSGLDEEYGTFDLAVDLGVLNRSGAWYSFASDGEDAPKYQAKKIRENKQLWIDRIYPEIERKLPEVWGYSSGTEQPNESEELDDDEPLEEKLVYKRQSTGEVIN